MAKNTWLILAGAALAGFALYEWVKASAAGVSPPLGPSPASSESPPAGGGVVSMPVVNVMAPANEQVLTQQQALMQWSLQTENPALYQMMITALSPSDTASLYDILTTDWEGTGRATAAQTSFWNGLVSRYPFLATGGVGCSNLNCQVQ